MAGLARDRPSKTTRPKAKNILSSALKGIAALPVK
jgi:hypothetical protein